MCNEQELDTLRKENIVDARVSAAQAYLSGKVNEGEILRIRDIYGTHYEFYSIEDALNGLDEAIFEERMSR